MLRPSTGPTAGSTVDRVVTMMPQMVMEWPHHLASGAARGGRGFGGAWVLGLSVARGTRGGMERLISLASASVVSTRESQPLPKRQKVGSAR